jgi:Lrp/AsnC family transcriptional regulator for asnA, asnC and gidA
LLATDAERPLDNAARTILEQLEHDGRDACSTAGTTTGLSHRRIRHRADSVLDGGVTR